MKSRKPKKTAAFDLRLLVSSSTSNTTIEGFLGRMQSMMHEDIVKIRTLSYQLKKQNL
jgi:hypothetical protein